jgi:predicted AAA+ superfamily ATPase
MKINAILSRKEGGGMEGQKLVQRQIYQDWLESWREKHVIKVVSGVRRCGKSTLFRLFTDYLVENSVKQEQIISVNLEDMAYESLLDYHALNEYIKERLYSGGTTYVFIDEVQNCRNFEKAVDSLFLTDSVDIYITGSNAYMLSGELATLLSGRYVRIEMLPLSFSEYISFKCDAGNDTRDMNTAFANYLRNGAFPAVAVLENSEALIASYLDGIYNSILLKDVAARMGISDILVLESIANFLFSNIGSPVSSKKISDTINSSGRTISINTVDKYLSALCDSYLFYRVYRYDIRGKQHLKTLGKYFAVDNGLREHRLSSSSSDIGHVLENIVYLELVRRGYKVSIGKLSDTEVDFVAESMNVIAYYQVSASVLDENTRERELRPLRNIQDQYPKILLTMDEIPRSADYEGIRQIHIIDWLLGVNGSM